MKEHGGDCDKLGRWGHTLGKQGGESPGVQALKQFMQIAQVWMPLLFIASHTQKLQTSGAYTLLSWGLRTSFN